MTEAWLAPFVCGGLFCPVPYMEDRGGAVWWAEPHPPNGITVKYSVGSGSRCEEAELKQKRLNFSSSQENGIIQYVLFIDVLFLSV